MKFQFTVRMCEILHLQNVLTHFTMDYKFSTVNVKQWNPFVSLKDSPSHPTTPKLSLKKCDCAKDFIHMKVIQLLQTKERLQKKWSYN